MQRRTLYLFALMLVACDAQAPESAAAPMVVPTVDGAVTPPLKARTQHSAKKSAVVPDARRAFDDVRALIEARYVDKGIGADVLYSGAIEGMLSRLIQLEETRVNRLLQPWELSELKLGVAGRFSGVGVVIKLVHGVCIVTEPIPGSPGAKAGLKKGDRILAVDGVDLADKTLSAIVGLIRGKAGTTLRLLMQRGRDEKEIEVRRGSIAIPAISSTFPAPGVAMIKIGQLNGEAVGQLDAELGRLRLARPAIRGLLVDLRGCPGGLLGVSIAVASRFLEKGALVTTIERRKGNEMQREERRADAPMSVDWPMVVLVDADTLSGGEIIAAALAENGRARVVGEKTAGKGTIEDIFELRGGWSLKLSVGRFFTPKGRALLGAGVKPDFEVSRDKDGAGAQLRAALHLLELTRQSVR